jgi:hypothetical protein
MHPAVYYIESRNYLAFADQHCGNSCTFLLLTLQPPSASTLRCKKHALRRVRETAPAVRTVIDWRFRC